MKRSRKHRRRMQGLGDGTEAHLREARRNHLLARGQVAQAGRTYRRGNCLQAGVHIDAALAAIAYARAHVQSAHVTDERVRLHDQIEATSKKLDSIDKVFERQCVRTKPKNKGG